jgi:hypothetical protein
MDALSLSVRANSRKAWVKLLGATTWRGPLASHNLLARDGAFSRPRTAGRGLGIFRPSGAKFNWWISVTVYPNLAVDFSPDRGGGPGRGLLGHSSFCY